MERNNEAKKMTVGTTSPACSWLAMEIFVLDSEEVMNSLQKCIPKRETKQACVSAKAL